jgi:DNA-binding MarR family transcriptional regulator
MVKDKVETLFLQEKPAKILLAARGADKPAYVAKLSKETDSTYAHTFRVVSKLEELGLVVSKEEGRVKLVKLTEMGEAVAGELLTLLDLSELVEIAVAVESLYEREVKGHLRGEIDKEAVLGRLEQQTKKLERLTCEKPEVVTQLAKKQLKRIDEISREVKGLIVG